MINTFVDSDLISRGWKLEIYGIPDDELYLKRLRELLENCLKLKFWILYLAMKKQK